jgi:hypothetical protein
LITVKLAFDPIAGCGHTRDVPETRTPGDAMQAGASHQHLHCLVANSDALPEDQVGMDTPDAVGAPRGNVHLLDDIREPDVADRTG